MQFPIFIANKNRTDFWKLDSSDSGHFLRNMQLGEGRYCYQSNDVSTFEATTIVMKANDGEFDFISESDYMAAVHRQAKRNQAILLQMDKRISTANSINQ